MQYAAIDTETTGLDESKDRLLQIAAYVTDSNYDTLDEVGFEVVFKHTEEEVEKLRASCLPIVRSMHDKTGLWDRLSAPGAVTYDEGDKMLSEYLLGFEGDELHMLGNSITLDRGFMKAFLPISFSHLHYRSLDVTSVRLFMEDKYGAEKVAYRNSNVEPTHEARDDILASLRQVKFYRSLLP